VVPLIIKAVLSYEETQKIQRATLYVKQEREP